MDVRLPDGTIIKGVPDGMSKADLTAKLKANGYDVSNLEASKESSLLDDIKQGAIDLGAGLVRGAGSIGATILAPVDMVNDALGGKGLSLESNRQRRADIDAGLTSLVGSDPNSLLYQGGKLGGEIAGTAGTGAVLGNAARAAGAAPGVVNALTTGGMRAGSNPGVMNMLTRVIGGATTGGAAAGLVDPSQAETGALIGGALPPAMALAGKAGGAIGRAISGPQVAPEVRQAVTAAREAGYVIPPTQAKPTLANRALEGFSGKITTAQNASARNQPITNELARKAIGAADLSPQGLAKVRQAANQAYDDLAQVGAFQADADFVKALDQAGSSTAAMRKNFPELANKEIDSIVEGLKSRPEFDAQSTIEAIKQFRSNASANRISTDPAKKALGKAQSKIAGALEDLIERNLEQIGSPELLTNYRSARQTLAKVYDVEKALNPSSGSIDASKLAAQLKKGRPLTGELKTIAEFALQFPKAAQSIERMGSLPQVSPLDFGAGAALSGVTANPLYMAGVLARPAARSLVLSGPVQNRLATSAGPNNLLNLLANPSVEQLAYRSAPVLGSSR